ncbi:MAG: hypothetical protein J6Z02_02520 [Lachnospiraceae bacterium]|nr:hypothetical protein [Lachnospiraceae bacterium]
MAITYNRVNWKDKQTALTTPMNAENLNKMDAGIKNLTDAFNDLTQDMERVRIYDSPEELPTVGQAKTIYFTK